GPAFSNCFFLFFVSFPNLLGTPGEKSLQFSYSNLALTLLQRGINTLPKYFFLLVEQLHFGRETKIKQTSGTMQVLQHARVCTCSSVAKQRGVATTSLQITTKLIALCYLRPE
ncbi:unnamed protein product, partial [Meganyctiphanes norvegica]